MNKEDFLKALEEELNIDRNMSVRINNIVEDTFIIGKKGKAQMINKFQEELDCSEKESELIYEACMKIIGLGIKEKIKHPFKGND